MSVWNGAWRLAMHEMKKERWGLLFTLVFVVYMLIFTIPSLTDSLETGGSNVFNWASDFLNIALLPIMGFVINRSMMNYWKNDYYSQKLAQWRTMPISLKQIVTGRIIQTAVTMMMSHLVLFTLAYLYMNHMLESFSLKSFVLYAVTWFCYSLATAISYLYWELGYSGFTYFLMTFAYLGFYFLLTTVLMILIKGSISVGLFQAFEQGYWWIALIAVAAVGLAIVGGIAITERRLANRNIGK